MNPVPDNTDNLGATGHRRTALFGTITYLLLLFGCEAGNVSNSRNPGDRSPSDTARVAMGDNSAGDPAGAHSGDEGSAHHGDIGPGDTGPADHGDEAGPAGDDTPRYDVNISIDGPGSVITADGEFDCQANCTVQVGLGETITLTAVRSSDARFVGWGGACSGNESHCTVTVEQATEVTASFVEHFALNVSIQGSGSALIVSDRGNIACGTDCSTSFDAGTVVGLTIEVGRRSRFLGWSGACVGMNRHCTFSVAAAVTATARVVPADDDVLVVVNDNAIDSTAVGEYYAAARGVAGDRIAHVQVPADYFITWTQFKMLRDQIIAFMQQHTLDDPLLTAATCDGYESPYYCPASVEQLRDHSTIRYVVTTRGVPTRMTVDGSTLSYPTGPTSVDNYLTGWLLTYYDADSKIDENAREIEFADGKGMRVVEPSFDSELIVGRIDGVDRASAMALVDRAVQAENAGLYGILYGSLNGGGSSSAGWHDYSVGRFTTIYGTADTAWRYQLGLVGESRASCIDYLQSSAGSAAGKAPENCKVRLTYGNDAPPGRASSREPRPFDAFFYLGWLDGQATTGAFTDFLNWRRDDSCTDTLCRNMVDPAACRALSTDAFSEINTDCVGVANGFVGFNLQSYPVSFLTVWPTAWYQSTSSTQWNHMGGGDINYLAFPNVHNDFGYDDSFSVTFGSTDEILDPLCFDSTDFAATPQQSCRSKRRIFFNQRVELPPEDMNALTPQTYRIGLWSHGKSLDANTQIRVTFYVHEAGAGNVQIPYPSTVLTTVPSGDSGWTWAETTIALDPALHNACAAPCSFDGVKIRVDTNRIFKGDLSFDAISLTRGDLPGAPELLINGSFDGGHEQVGAGDHASNFLSRLNGTAFFGSLSHHSSGGWAFGAHPQQTLLYFLRGLELGDAVWLGEYTNSGILYGDPLYSPTAVRIHRFDAGMDRVAGGVNIYADTVNGWDSSAVTTDFAVDYCLGSDFFICDQLSAWQPTGLAGVGGRENQALGHWVLPLEMPFGAHVLRLEVASTHQDGRNQKLYDYYPFWNFTGCPIEQGAVRPADMEDWGDLDGDGIGNPCDPDQDGDAYDDDVDAFPMDAAEWFDTDGDGLGNNADADDDNDAASDTLELLVGTDPMVPQPFDFDSDGDGVANVIEFRRGSDPLGQFSVPSFTTIYVDGTSSTGIEDGSVLNPYVTVEAGVAAGLDGDTIDVANGTYPESIAITDRSLHLVGHGSELRFLVVRPQDGGLPAHLTSIDGVRAALVMVMDTYGVSISDVTSDALFFMGGISAENADGLRLERVRALHSTFHGLSLRDSMGVEVYQSSFAGNMAGLELNNSEVYFSNSIIAGVSVSIESGADSTTADPPDTSAVTGDYNLFNTAVGSYVDVTHMLIADPGYTDWPSGDLHLDSASIAIDAGNPASPYSSEPTPNGGRVNLGFYGNTAEAAPSP